MIAKMLIPLILTLIMMNAMFLFMVELPTDMNNIRTYGTEISEYGGLANMLSGQLTEIQTDATYLQTEADALSENSASTEPSIIPEPFKNLLYGAKVLIDGVSTTIGLGAFFVKWLFLALFGFIIWIDLLLVPAWGAGVVAIGLGLKAMLGFIVAKGLLDILLPLFTGWRGN